MYPAECVGEGVVPRRALSPNHLTAMSHIPPAGGSPVRRSDLSEHVLYQRDADDWHADSEAGAFYASLPEPDPLSKPVPELSYEPAQSWFLDEDGAPRKPDQSEL